MNNTVEIDHVDDDDDDGPDGPIASRTRSKTRL